MFLFLSFSVETPVYGVVLGLMQLVKVLEKNLPSVLRALLKTDCKVFDSLSEAENEKKQKTKPAVLADYQDTRCRTR